MGTFAFFLRGGLVASHYLEMLDLLIIFLVLHKASKEFKILKKAWQFISIICKIYTTTTMNFRDITSLRWGYLILFDPVLGPHGGDFDQKIF